MSKIPAWVVARGHKALLPFATIAILA